MATNGVDWIQSALPRIRSMLPPVVADLLSRSNGGQTILDPPSHLQSMRSRFLLFLGFSAMLTSFVWFCICMVLYPLGTEYQVMNLMYESRWLLSTILFGGISAILLAIFKFETFYVLCGLSTAYNCAGSLIVLIVYSHNFYKARYQKYQTPVTARMIKQPRQKYLQICGCMIVVALMAFMVGLMILGKLKRLARMYYAPLLLQKTQQSYLLFSAFIQIPFVWFSVYVASHVISLQFSYVQQYMIQELFCALILQTLIILQILNAYHAKTDRLSLKLLLVLNLCQTVQEIFYTWNSYYISLYIHSSKAKLAVGAREDQYLMGVNFLGHFLRMCLAACTAYRIVLWLDAPLINTKFQRFELSIGVRRILLGLSVSALLLSVAHLIMDISYTMAAHLYRTLIAFTGISVFYLTLIGISLALFLKTSRIILLIVTFVLTLLLTAVSAHALYIYLDMSFHNVLLTHLETLGKEKRQPSYMHFAEACLALGAFMLCIITGSLIFRLLHIESVHDRRDGRLKRPLQILFLLGIVQLTLTIINSIVLMSIKDEPRVFQSMLAYGVLDTLSTVIMCLTQIYVTRPSNSHVNYGLTALLFFLICEMLTTYNYLSTKTAYVQLLIVFNRMFAGNRLLPKNRLANLFPTEEVALMISSHGIQLVQWFLIVTSLSLTALTLEILYEQRKEFSGSLPVSATEASRTTSIGSVPLNSALPGPSSASERVGRYDKNENPIDSEANSQNSYDNPIYKIGEKKNQPMDAVALLESGRANKAGATGTKEGTTKDDEPLIHQQPKIVERNGSRSENDRFETEGLCSSDD